MLSKFIPGGSIHASPLNPLWFFMNSFLICKIACGLKETLELLDDAREPEDDRDELERDVAPFELFCEDELERKTLVDGST